uniref:Uncharacterized protein n=1 Tax=Rhizophora mucronata TaxID=61149 RepID=A0A2P2MY03_RHIMU
MTSSLLPSGNVCQEGINSTIWSATQRSHSISLLHINFFSEGNGSSLQSCPKILAQRFVMAFEIAKAVQTPFPDPDMSSPSNNFPNRSFIISISEIFELSFLDLESSKRVFSS